MRITVPELLGEVLGARTDVLAISPLEHEQLVYNFEVEENHDYFVGSTGLLVHNGQVCFPDGSKITNIVNATPTSPLSTQLALESAESTFTETGELSEEAIASAEEIISPSKIVNPDVPAGFGKFSTQTYQSPVGNFQVHFYMNPATREVFYGLDYKLILNDGI